MNTLIKEKEFMGVRSGRIVIQKGRHCLVAKDLYQRTFYNFGKTFSFAMTIRDGRYELIKPMLNEGKIVFFNDIFKYIPKTVVATDLGKKVDRFSELMKRVEKFTLEELFTIGRFCSLDETQIFFLARDEYLKSKSKILKNI